MITYYTPVSLQKLCANIIFKYTYRQYRLFYYKKYDNYNDYLISLSFPFAIYTLIINQYLLWKMLE